jgi:hypothetical protein
MGISGMGGISARRIDLDNVQPIHDKRHGEMDVNADNSSRAQVVKEHHGDGHRGESDEEREDSSEFEFLDSDDISPGQPASGPDDGEQHFLDVKV